MHQLLRPLLIALIALTGLFATPVHATLLAEATVRELIGSGSNVICTDGGSAATNATTTCSGIAFNGDGRAMARYGSVATYAELAHGSPPSDNSQDFQTFGRARFSDTVNVVPLVPGLFTDARFVFNVTTGPGAFVPPPFLAGGNLSAFSTFTVKINGLELSPSNRPFNGAGEYWFDFNFGPGPATSLSVELISDVRCFDCRGPYNGISNLWGTAVLSALEVTGLDPSQFAATSEAGATYANIVPEPSALALLLIGGGGLLAARGRQRSPSSRASAAARAWAWRESAKP